jgi:hypothetical protein
VKRSMRQFSAAAIILVILATVCGLFILNGCINKKPSAAYSTFLTLYHRAPAEQDVLTAYDYIITGPTGYFTLEERHRKKALLYFDIWGSSAYKGHPDRVDWQSRPGDIGHPDIELGNVHCYTWDEHHVERFTGWVKDALETYPCAGIFLDDWAADRFWWVASGDSVQMAMARDVWPFYPRNTWLWAEVQQAEKLVTAEVYRALGADGLLVANGPGGQLPSTKRMAEHAGCFAGSHCKNTWARMTTEGMDSNRYLKEGDFLLEYLLLADGSLDIAGVNHLKHMVSVAKEFNCAVGIGYRVTPESGGSRCQQPPGEWGVVGNWPDYWEPK